MHTRTGVGWRDAPDGLLPEADMAEADWAQLRAFRTLVAQQARRLIKIGVCYATSRLKLGVCY